MGARLWRGARKLAAGVPLGGERVWPGDATDLFVAHLSIYRFFAREAYGKRILDAGCGLGYGSALLHEAGGQPVLGFDVDRRAIEYARRSYGRDGLAFEMADCQRLALESESFDLIVSSNTLEHLRAPEKFAEAARSGLARSGQMIVAVPPNNAPALQADNRKNPHHHSNFDVTDWIAIFARTGFSARVFRHFHSEMDALDFESFAPSRFKPEDFRFVEVAPEALASCLTLTVVFVLQLEEEVSDRLNRQEQIRIAPGPQDRY